MGLSFPIAHSAILLLITVILIKKYRLTKDKGLLILLLAFVVWPLIKDSLELLFKIQVEMALAGEKAMFPFSIIRNQGSYEEFYQTPAHFKMYYYWLLNFIEVFIYFWAALLLYRRVRSQPVAAPDAAPPRRRA